MIGCVSIPTDRRRDPRQGRIAGSAIAGACSSLRAALRLRKMRNARLSVPLDKSRPTMAHIRSYGRAALPSVDVLRLSIRERSLGNSALLATSMGCLRVWERSAHCSSGRFRTEAQTLAQQQRSTSCRDHAVTRFAVGQTRSDLGMDDQSNEAFSAYLIDGAPRRSRCGASCLVLNSRVAAARCQD